MSAIRTDPTRVSCREAALRGLSRFYTGDPCKSGHTAERFVSNRQCVECNAARARHRERVLSIKDPSYRMYRNVQRRSGKALKGIASPVEAVACTRLELRTFIERRFRKGMSWAKYRQWEVDHIVPLSSARSARELTALCHYTNLQPLWRQENLSKGGSNSSSHLTPVHLSFPHEHPLARHNRSGSSPIGAR